MACTYEIMQSRINCTSHTDSSHFSYGSMCNKGSTLSAPKATGDVVGYMHAAMHGRVKDRGKTYINILHTLEEITINLCVLNSNQS